MGYKTQLSLNLLAATRLYPVCSIPSAIMTISKLFGVAGKLSVRGHIDLAKQMSLVCRPQVRPVNGLEGLDEQARATALPERVHNTVDLDGNT